MVHQRIDKVEVTMIGLDLEWGRFYQRLEVMDGYASCNEQWVFKKSRMVHQRIDEVEVDEDYDRTRFVSLKSQNIYYGT
ncbi:hypothetical protein H5410_002489 [Solanum commersonii]|uniref:Uncharacterized protein n=1 Tax=Solanum commersonii TaxID=4109 RepID=A0A9J6B2A0_SOLCO|nr:hypothetical protein H5410_002489 [Solanum commersonii]